MSWSIGFIGKPENVVVALKAESDKFTGQSKVEYDDALPHLIGIVEQAFAKRDSGHRLPTVKIQASGSGYASNGEQIERSISVAVDTNYVQVV